VPGRPRPASTMTSTSSSSPSEAEAFVVEHAALGSAPLVPEVRLWLASEVTPLWYATEQWLDIRGVSPPFWAFAWPGGQAVARYVLDHPELVRGRRVVDLAAGSGLGGIAAALAGARDVLATDIDPLALAAISLNARENGVVLRTTREDLLSAALPEADVVLIGDGCYEQPMASQVMAWAKRCASAGMLVLLGEPGRSYAPREGFERLQSYLVATPRDLESRDAMATDVLRIAAH